MTSNGRRPVPLRFPRRNMSRLTKRLIDAATSDPSGVEIFLWDGEVKGFGVRLKPSGTKSFILKYRIADKTRRYTISKVGSPYTVEQARQIAADTLRDIRAGRDPMQAKAANRGALTLSDLAAAYLEEGPAEKPNKKASSWATDKSIVERHIRPLLGSRIAAAITKADIERFQANVAAGKTAADIKTRKQGRAIVRGGKPVAARSLAVLGAMLQFGVGRGIVQTNAARGVKLLRGERKERFLSEVEVARLADALAAMEAEGLNSRAAAAIRLLLLTGCRRDEILNLRWKDVDFERQCLRLPDSKTGAKIVPLAAAALELLAGLPREVEWVLPGKAVRSSATPKKTSRRPTGRPQPAELGRYKGLPKAWQRVRARANLPGLRLHDLRHSFASFAVADGATLFMVGKVLGHKQTRTTEIYAHLADDPVRAVADRAATRITNAMKGNKAGGAEVVPLVGRK
jgi:integrase